MPLIGENQSIWVFDNVDLSVQNIVLVSETIVQCFADDPRIIALDCGGEKRLIRHVFHHDIANAVGHFVCRQQHGRAKMLRVDGPVMLVSQKPGYLGIDRSKQV